MTLEQRKDQLEQRLQDGWTRIAEAEREGKDVEKWTDFWTALLGEYRRVCDEILEGSHAA